MKKLVLAICFILMLNILIAPQGVKEITEVHAKDVQNKYYTVYDADSPEKVIFVKGEGVNSGDEYVSSDNKLYEVIEVNEMEKKGKAKFKQSVSLP